jgi:hypothetical protein
MLQPLCLLHLCDPVIVVLLSKAMLLLQLAYRTVQTAELSRCFSRRRPPIGGVGSAYDGQHLGHSDGCPV